MFTELLTEKSANKIKRTVLSKIKLVANMCEEAGLVYSVMRRSREAGIVSYFHDYVTDFVRESALIVEKWFDKAIEESLNKGELEVVFLYRMVFQVSDQIEEILRSAFQETLKDTRGNVVSERLFRVSGLKAIDITISIVRVELFNALMRWESKQLDTWMKENADVAEKTGLGVKKNRRGGDAD